MANVLILTNKIDDHARTVAECLAIKGAKPIRWFPGEFLVNQKGIQKITPHGEISILIKEDDRTIDLTQVDVVWYRRSKFALLPKHIDPADQKFVEIENRQYMQSLWLTLGESAKWVNPYPSFDKSNCKALQLREAARQGLSIPETLITNDKEAITNFVSENGKAGTIYKTFSPPLWDENSNSFNFYTTDISFEILPEESILKLTPGIYQKKIIKSFEVRITFFGKEYIAVKIHNSEELDWRSLSETPKLKLSAIKIPLDIEKKCIHFMEKLDIVFGCFDFIVTPGGEYIFLEVNEMGQFLWIEQILPELKLLNKFCDFLLSNEKKTGFKDQKIISLKEITDSQVYNKLVKQDVEEYKIFEKYL